MSFVEKRIGEEADEKLQPSLKIQKTESTVEEKEVEKPSDDDEYEINDVEVFKHEYSEWHFILEQKLKEGKKHEISEAFEKYLSQYVNDGDKWADYIEWMMSVEKDIELDKKRIESSFFKVLTKVYNIKLWRLYLKYVELINPITPDNGEKARSIVLKAYKFAIDTVGIDFFKSHEIWGDYLKYLYLWQTVNPNEASTREDLIRKALKTMIGYPSLNLEENWKTFVKFETDLNLNKSRNIIAENEVEYLKIKEVNFELIKVTKSIIPMNERKYNSRQISKWRKWIEWEKQNKLKLNKGEVDRRVNYVYNLSVQYLRLIPEVWFNYWNYVSNEKNDIKKGKELLEDGVAVNPVSLILNNELSKILEKNNDLEGLKNIWLNLIKNIKININIDNSKIITYCYCQLMKIVNRSSNINEVRKVFKLARQYKKIEWVIYKDYGLIEYYNNETKIATRSFSLGMQYFKRNISFVIEYLNFLLRVKDMANFKKTIEISIENFKEIGDNKSLKILFNKYYEVEERFGDVNSINSLFKRYAKIFGEFDSIKLLYSGLKNESGEIDAVKILDQYRNTTDTVESESDIEITGSNEKIKVVINGLKDDDSKDNIDIADEQKDVNENEILIKLQSFLAALPQDDGMRDQMKSLSIGQLLEFFGNAQNNNTI
jgi:cleavage stimulation factor subunit 3